MQAFVFTANGGPEVEQLTDRPRPEPGPGQLLVAVHAAGVNPADWKRRSGFRRPGMPEPVFPTVFGAEAAGVVEAVGAGDTGGLVPGDAVFGSPVTGGYAEYTLIPADTAAKLAALSFTDAATLPVAAATAWTVSASWPCRPARRCWSPARAAASGWPRSRSPCMRA